MRAQGKALLCCATPLEDVEIEIAVDSIDAADAPSLARYQGRVEQLERLSDTVIRLRLSVADGKRIDFAAGQYPNVLLEVGQTRAFSFANPPHDNTLIALHVRLIQLGRASGRERVCHYVSLSVLRVL